jgi:hypothetical protein
MSVQYEPSQDGQTPGYWPPKRKRRWPWVVAGITGFLVILAICGGLTLAGGGGEGHEFKTVQVSRLDDIKITACTMGEGGLATVKYTIHNSTKTKQDYLPTFNIEDASGTVYGQTADIVNGLEPGKDYHGSAVGTFGDASADNVICKLTGA